MDSTQLRFQNVELVFVTQIGCAAPVEPVLILVASMGSSETHNRISSDLSE
jgi:hypothetical protein